MPRPDSAEVGTHSGASFPRKSSRAPFNSRACFFAAAKPSPSALLTATRSTLSRIPRLMPCRASPDPAMVRNTTRSTTWLTWCSDCPTPTVSTITRPNPAASHTSATSRVVSAVPPRCPEEGEGRMNASGSRDNSAILVLSPRMLPPVRLLEGSTARTATRWPPSTR